MEDPFGDDYYDHPLDFYQVDFDLELVDLISAGYDVPRPIFKPSGLYSHPRVELNKSSDDIAVT